MTTARGNVIKGWWNNVPKTSDASRKQVATIEDLSEEDRHMIEHDLEVLAQVIAEKERACVIADGDFMKAEMAKAKAHDERREAVEAFHAERRKRGIPNE